MENHVSDTWQAMCHIAWQRPMNVGHIASHVCGTWQSMCVTHGMPCVIMHGHVKTYKYEIGGEEKIQFVGE